MQMSDVDVGCRCRGRLANEAEGGEADDELEPVSPQGGIALVSIVTRERNVARRVRVRVRVRARARARARVRVHLGGHGGGGGGARRGAAGGLGVG